jgi:hypothetical protein
MNSDYWNNAVGVLKASTLNSLAAQVSKEAVIVLDGWCATNKRQMKAWEKDGSLPQRAKEVNQQIQEVLEEHQRNSKPGDPALANHEIYEIYGKPQLVL